MKIPTKILKAISIFAAAKKSDVRYYLEGLHIVKTGAVIRITASDGATLATATCVDEADLSEYELIVGPDILPLNSKAEFLEIDKVHGGLLLTDQLNNTSRIFQPIEGVYPKCELVWPKEEKFERDSATYNPEYLARIGKVQKTLKVDDYSFWHSKNSLVFRCGPVRGIISSRRENRSFGDMPQW